MFAVDWNSEMVIAAEIAMRWRRERRKGVDHRELVVVFTLVDLGEMPNPNPLLWSKFHGSKYQIRTGYVGVITEFNLAHVLKPLQIVQSLFNAILGLFTGLNKLSLCE